MPARSLLRFPTLVLGLLAGLCAAPAACSFDPASNQAHGCKDCPIGQCYLGYCLTHAGTAGSPFDPSGVSGQSGPSTSIDARVPTGGGSGRGGSSKDAAVDAETPPPTGPCVAGGACYLGPAATRGKGNCKDGTAQCDHAAITACVGQVAPTPESCNAADDDCDGEIDEDVLLGSCSMPGGACGTGVLRCQGGSAVCVASTEPAKEICNGLDDDCDGTVDNDSDVVCYPANQKGCTQNADGTFTCAGQCKAGKQTCMNGQLQACTGAVIPAKEQCGGDQAVDEDCDGKVDNGCPCSGNQSQICYSGGFLTNFFGVCRVGTQRCMNGTFGACEGEVTPSAESCANQGADNDCNGTVDDVTGLGQSCTVGANMGVCRSGTVSCQSGKRVCATPAPAQVETKCDGLDDDCDGKTDEDFAFATDEANCGTCGHACGTGELCCASGCRTIASDTQYCGSCGVACVGGTACCGGMCCGSNQACCNGMCVTTGTDSNCMACGDQCGAGKSCCNNTCTPIGTNDRCANCNDHCTTDQACCGGACQTKGMVTGCGNGQTCCTEGCVTPGTHDHCMACMACGVGETCCGTSCNNLLTDSLHCGTCDKACTGACTCMNGTCMDAMGMTTCP